MKKVTERRYMSYDDRKKFARLYRRGASPEELAATFGIHVSTVYRELMRGLTDGYYSLGRPRYSPIKAHAAFTRSLSKRGRKRDMRKMVKG